MEVRPVRSRSVWLVLHDGQPRSEQLGQCTDSGHARRHRSRWQPIRDGYHIVVRDICSIRGACSFARQEIQSKVLDGLSQRRNLCPVQNRYADIIRPVARCVGESLPWAWVSSRVGKGCMPVDFSSVSSRAGSSLRSTSTSGWCTRNSKGASDRRSFLRSVPSRVPLEVFWPLV